MTILKQLAKTSLQHWWDSGDERIENLQSVFAEYRQIVRDETIIEIQQIMNDNYILSWADKIIELKENKQ